MPALKKSIGKIHKRHENHLPPTKRMKTEGCCTIKREKCISNVFRKTVTFKLDFLNRYKNRREISGSQLCLSPLFQRLGTKAREVSPFKDGCFSGMISNLHPGK